MSDYKPGDVLVGRSLGREIKLVQRLAVDGEAYWVFQVKNLDANTFVNGQVSMGSEHSLAGCYDTQDFEEKLFPGQLWLAESNTGDTEAFVARKIPNIGVRLWNIVDVMWSDYASWTNVSGYTNFRRAARGNGKFL